MRRPTSAPASPRSGASHGHSRTSCRERRRQVHGPVDLVLLLRGPPGRVVAVLVPPARIDPDRLDPPSRLGADPHVGLCGREVQRVDPLLRRRVGRRTIGLDVSEAVVRPFPHDARIDSGLDDDVSMSTRLGPTMAGRNLVNVATPELEELRWGVGDRSRTTPGVRSWRGC